MPVCELCDGETFESRDGLFYCLTCGTQSQDIREELDENMGDVDPRLAMKRKGAKMGRKSFERASGKPWVMHEAFQIVIKKQLEFLIQIGVDAKIKDVVGQIWFKYLKETGIAFCGKADSVLPSVGYLKKGCVFQHNAQMLGRNESKKKRRKQMSDMDDEMLELSSQISKDESFHGENPAHNTESKNESNTSEEEEEESLASDSDDESVGSFAIKDIHYTRRMMLQTTLAFSYLGLLYLNEPIFLSDILRWVREGHFPYFEASTLLPDYMKFSHKDSVMLTRPFLPTRENVICDAAFIVKLVRLKLPEQDLRKYTARYIMDLNLPAIAHGLVNNLLRQYTPDKEFWSFRGSKGYSSNMLQIEETAMAYIIMALKMCYGLDDSQHQTEADMAKQLNTTESRDSLPVWLDWVSATRQCQAKTQASGVPWSHEQLRQTRDPRSYLNFCKTNIFGSWGQRDLEMVKGRKSVLGPKKKGTRKEFRENWSEIFSNLTEGSSATGQPLPTPSSFPNTCRHGNASANDEQDHSCFRDCLVRRIPLQDFQHLCTSSESEKLDKGKGDDEGSSSSRKYIKYLRRDFNGDTCHPSFRFLLGVTAKHIEAKPQELELVVMKMEDLMVGDVKKKRSVSKRRMSEELQ